LDRREIKAATDRLGLKQKDVAKAMGIKYETYCKKARGGSPFTFDEKLALGQILGLDFKQLNDFLFDGKLPIG